MLKYLLLSSVLLFISCHSIEKFPEAADVKIGANVPNEKCQAISKVTGRSSSKYPDEKAVLEDLKKEASLKGGNYVQIMQKSAQGTEATGLAFKCP